jgi:hypothetical protein
MKKLFLTALVLLGLILALQAQKRQTIGKKYGGGIVFNVTPDGLHGLIVETQDQGACNWNEAPALIANPSNHSAAGKAFTDWRLPDKEEMYKLYKQRKIVGGFTNYYYWSSTEKDTAYVWNKTFTSGAEMTNIKFAIKYVRAIRKF